LQKEKKNSTTLCTLLRIPCELQCGCRGPPHWGEGGQYTYPQVCQVHTAPTIQDGFWEYSTNLSSSFLYSSTSTKKRQLHVLCILPNYTYNNSLVSPTSVQSTPVTLNKIRNKCLKIYHFIWRLICDGHMIKKEHFSYSVLTALNLSSPYYTVRQHHIVTVTTSHQNTFRVFCYIQRYHWSLDLKAQVYIIFFLHLTSPV
jgi:hypothetical protein